jgi:hypothetical protein
MKITTVGIDLAKNVLQVHAMDERGKTVLRKQLRRGQMVEFFANLAASLDVGLLADLPEAIPTVARWYFDEWGDRSPSTTFAANVAPEIRPLECPRRFRLNGVVHLTHPHPSAAARARHSRRIT